MDGRIVIHHSSQGSFKWLGTLHRINIICYLPCRVSYPSFFNLWNELGLPLLEVRAYVLVRNDKAVLY